MPKYNLNLDVTVEAKDETEAIQKICTPINQAGLVYYSGDIEELDDIESRSQTSITYKDLAILMGGSGKFAMGGIESIQVNAPVLKGLADDYPEMFDLTERQNDSPTVKEFLDGATEACDIFLVYVVSDSREDKRVSIEGILTMSKSICDHFKQWKPDEYSKSQGQYRLWWD